MEKELESTNLKDEKIRFYFTDIDSGNSTSEPKGIKEDLENVMIITEKRIIFIHIPRIGLKEITSGNFKESFQLATQRNGLKTKVEELIEKEGLEALVNSSKKAYSMNYSEIEEIRLKTLLSKCVFIYRGMKYRYFIRRDQIEDFKNIFKNYLEK